MANINPVITRELDGNPNVIKVFWETLTSTNTAGAAVKYPDYTIRSVQVTGTFGASGSVSMQGSNDNGTTYATLNTDNASAAMTYTAAGIKKLSEITQLIKPVVTISDGTTDLDVTMILVKP